MSKSLKNAGNFSKYRNKYCKRVTLILLLQKSHKKYSIKKVVRKNFSKYTEKHLC